MMQTGQMMGQTQMQRENSSMDGQQRPQTPGSGENAPSPKRQRLDGGGSFNGQMMPMGRGQPQGMQGQQVRTPTRADVLAKLAAVGVNSEHVTEHQLQMLQMQTPQVQAKSMQVYANSMRQSMQTAMDSNAQKGMPNPNGFPQGSPAMDAANAEFLNANAMRGMPGQPPGGANQNALQDYQMQLMLLEQQNKKRLLMARQEQDSVNNGANGPMPGQQFAPVMSPSNSRAGPSPNPDEQMKRGTPKMAPGGIPLQNPDGSMAQGRGSPAPGFDPSQMNPNMPPQMFQQMAKMNGMMGPNGHMMPATSHPAMMNGQPPMNQQQQMEFIRQQQAANRPNGPNGPWQGPPGMMPGQPQQPQNMTPQQRNAAMPPPPAPAQGEPAARTQPSSPSQSAAAPPTPVQSNKPNPQKKKDTAKNNKVCPLSCRTVGLGHANKVRRSLLTRRVELLLQHL